VKKKRNITPFSGGTSTLHVLDKLNYPYASSLNVLIVSLMNALQGIRLLQAADTLIPLHLLRTDAMLQIHQVRPKSGDVMLDPPEPMYLGLNRLVAKRLDTLVHLFAVRVSHAEEEQVAVYIAWALAHVEKGCGVKMVRVRGGASDPETVDHGIVGVLHLGKLGGPDTSIGPSDRHWYILRS
jgi:hypothetical protein